VYETLLYDVAEGVATITFNRPERLNTVTPQFADDLDAALAAAGADGSVRVVRLRGAGRAFCAGYDIDWAVDMLARQEGDRPWDPMRDYEGLSRYVSTYMSLWRSSKPVVAQVHGACVGGGSDLALCSDLILCADDCRIGYPPARVWGSPTTAMWFYRVGLERAKRLLLTGEPLDGPTAVEWGFASGSYPADRLDEAGMELCRRMARVPSNQLHMMKLLVNTAVEQMGLGTSQVLGTLLDGAARHTPEGVDFATRAASSVREAVAERDAPWGDYAQGSRTVASPLVEP
jgi:enoyl-CoA hydratase